MTLAFASAAKPDIFRTPHGAYRLTQTTRVGMPLNQVFDFFADARNLNRITPPWLHFEILTKGDIEMRQSVQIEYQLKLRGIPLRWTSEITIWDPPRMFVDTQIRGPYKEWHHSHLLTEIDVSTTEVSDQVDYRVPGGRLINKLFVKRDLEAIFNYRSERIIEFLGGVR
jgi:ligand-binding SRPBCC domain-containing protein